MDAAGCGVRLEALLFCPTASAVAPTHCSSSIPSSHSLQLDTFDVSVFCFASSPDDSAAATRRFADHPNDAPRRCGRPLPLIVPTALQQVSSDQRSHELDTLRGMSKRHADEGAWRRAARHASAIRWLSGFERSSVSRRTLHWRHSTRASDGAQKEPQMRVVPSHRGRCLRPATADGVSKRTTRHDQLGC